jgi:hypothetical protein
MVSACSTAASMGAPSPGDGLKYIVMRSTPESWTPPASIVATTFSATGSIPLEATGSVSHTPSVVPDAASSTWIARIAAASRASAAVSPCAAPSMSRSMTCRP